jgi:hypothetical protein
MDIGYISFCFIWAIGFILTFIALDSIGNNEDPGVCAVFASLAWPLFWLFLIFMIVGVGGLVAAVVVLMKAYDLYVEWRNKKT